MRWLQQLVAGKQIEDLQVQLDRKKIALSIAEDLQDALRCRVGTLNRRVERAVNTMDRQRATIHRLEADNRRLAHLLEECRAQAAGDDTETITLSAPAFWRAVKRYEGEG